jgi:hypothetical protein
MAREEDVKREIEYGVTACLCREETLCMEDKEGFTILRGVMHLSMCIRLFDVAVGPAG